MRITRIVETPVRLRGEIANAMVDFSSHTVSLVAVVSDVMRHRKPVTGVAFNSIGRYAQSGILRDRMIPRVLGADPGQLVDDAGRIDPAKALAHAIADEKPGGHGDRAAAAAALELACWDLNAKLDDEPAYVTIARYFGRPTTPARVQVYAAGASLPYPEVESIARVWAGAGFEAAAVIDIAAMQWEKLICNVAYSALFALTGLTVGQVMEDPDLSSVSHVAATEAWTVARASAIAVAVTDPVAHVQDFGARLPAAKPSALLDHEAHQVSEIDGINGAVVRQAEQVSAPVPVNTTLTALVKSIERQWPR